MPAARSTSPSSGRVIWWPPERAAVNAAAARTTCLFIELQLSVAGGKAQTNLVPGEIQQPADVLRNHEMPGRAHDVVRRIAPWSKRRSNLAAVSPRLRCSSAHLAPA